VIIGSGIQGNQRQLNPAPAALENTDNFKSNIDQNSFFISNHFIFSRKLNRGEMANKRYIVSLYKIKTYKKVLFFIDLKIKYSVYRIK